MKKLNKMLAFILIVGLTLTTVHIISAQQRSGRPGTGGGPGGGRPGGNMDPAAMMERMMERRMENISEGMQEMNIPDNEADILKTQIEALLRARMAPNTEMTQAMEALQKALDEKDNEQIKSNLDAVKTMRKQRKDKDEKMEKELLEILPLKVEAFLTVQGVVNGGSGGGMFFGRGTRGGPGGGRTGNRAGGRRQSNETNQQ